MRAFHVALTLTTLVSVAALGSPSSASPAAAHPTAAAGGDGIDADSPGDCETTVGIP